jgi:hypothetical protein
MANKRYDQFAPEFDATKFYCKPMPSLVPLKDIAVAFATVIHYIAADEVNGAVQALELLPGLWPDIYGAVRSPAHSVNFQNVTVLKACPTEHNPVYLLAAPPAHAYIARVSNSLVLNSHTGGDILFFNIASPSLPHHRCR